MYIIFGVIALFIFGFLGFKFLRKDADVRFEESQESIRNIEKLQETTIYLMKDESEFLKSKYPEYSELINDKIPLVEKIAFNTLAKDFALKEKLSNLNKDMEDGLVTMKDLGNEYLSDDFVESFFMKINIKI